MPVSVSDARSNPNDQIAHAANVLKRSRRLRAMFEAICKGGKKPKTVGKLRGKVGLSQVAVLQLGGRLADQQLVHKTKVGKETAYEKDRFYASNRAKILKFAGNPNALKGLPTKYAPKSTTSLRMLTERAKVKISEITCDDFDQFAKVRAVKDAPPRSVSERAFKDGIQKLIGETGKFQDWGGEPNDLFTSKLRHRGQRRSVAFAFKGPGTKGILTPGKLGKNGDQIQRLFQSPAEIYIVQYHSQIAQSVMEQMKLFAIAKAFSERARIWFGVMDGDDTNRLMAAYPRQFGLK